MKVSNFIKLIVLLILAIQTGCFSNLPEQEEQKNYSVTGVPETNSLNNTNPTESAQPKNQITPSTTPIVKSTINQFIHFEPDYILGIPEELKQIGGLILSGTDPYSPNIQLLELSNLRTKPLISLRFMEIQFLKISTDFKHIAYKGTYPGGISQLIVSNQSAEIVLNISWDNSWRHIIGWLDGQQLLLSRINQNPKRDKKKYLNPITNQEIEYVTNPDSVIVLNTKSGDTFEIEPSYPDIIPVNLDPGGINWGFYSNCGTVYDPKLTRAVYPTETSIVLWNMENHKEVHSLPWDYDEGVPVWLKDGSGFLFLRLFSAYDNLFFVNRDGYVSQLADFHSFSYQSGMGNPVPSPDGQFIAFWLAVWNSDHDILKPADEVYLAIQEVKNKKITIYTIPDGMRYDPVWSPEGNWIAFQSNSNQDNQDERNLYFLNAISGSSARISIKEHLYLMGWVNDENTVDSTSR